jgi:hypothetical protein
VAKLSTLITLTDLVVRLVSQINAKTQRKG